MRERLGQHRQSDIGYDDLSYAGASEGSVKTLGRSLIRACLPTTLVRTLAIRIMVKKVIE